MKQLSFFVLVLTLSTLAYTSGATVHVIEVGPESSLTFFPDSLVVHVGDTVRWEWNSGFHTTTADSGDIPPGAPLWNDTLSVSNPTFEYKVLVPGKYHYDCHFHENLGMKGVFVAVTVASTPAAAPTFRLQASPNPTSGRMAVSFQAQIEESLEADLVSPTGSIIRLNAQQPSAAGRDRTLVFDFSEYGLATGCYLLRIRAGSAYASQRILFQ